MTVKKRWPIWLGIFIVIVITIILTRVKSKRPEESTQEIRPVPGSIQASITSTATVQPQNRLEIKPPINGRIEQILVKEGDRVKAGQTLVWMSSTDRAALLDAARSRGPEAVKYWEDVYKPAPLISPIDGEVIVSKDEPGQTVTSNDPVVVLSDYLIVQAQVDETDIGKVKIGQEAYISLDAYPQIKIKGTINHIYYESLVVNNVTIYQVDILPAEVPAVFRSGMNATVTIMENEKNDVLTLPVAAVKKKKDGAYVLVRRGPGKNTEERKIEVGISDDKNIEIVSGLTAQDKVLMAVQKYKAVGADKGPTNPLSPFRRRR